MPDSIKYEENPIFDELTEGDDAPFNKFRLLIFAACVGFAHERFIESPGRDLETRWMFIQGQSAAVDTDGADLRRPRRA